MFAGKDLARFRGGITKNIEKSEQKRDFWVEEILQKGCEKG